MTINRITFDRFLDLIITKGDFQTKEAVFKFMTDRIRVICSDAGTRILAEYDVDTGMDGVSVGIEDLAGFKKVLKSFKNPSIVMVKSGNKLMLSSETDKHTVGIVLHKAELMTATPEHEKVSSQIARASGNLVVMTDEHMTDFARYADSIKFDAVEIKSVVDNTIEFKFNKKNKEDITGSFEFTGGIKPFEVIFGRRFTDILTTIGAGLRLSISNNELCYAGFSAEGCRADYLIAPIRQGE